MKRFFAFVLLSVMLMTIVLSVAFAGTTYTTRTCMHCQEAKLGTFSCPSGGVINAKFSTHNASYGICNYYTQQTYKTWTCLTCKTYTWTTPERHDHVMIHECEKGVIVLD